MNIEVVYNLWFIIWYYKAQFLERIAHTYTRIYIHITYRIVGLQSTVYTEGVNLLIALFQYGYKIKDIWEKWYDNTKKNNFM